MKMTVQISKLILQSITLALLVFSLGLTAAPKKKKAAEEPVKESEQLAKVSILNYEDKTGTKDFEYMPGSLTDAIDKALQKRFLYTREAPEKSEKVAKDIKTKAKKFGPEEAEEYCKKTGTDILVLGSFTFDKDTNEIVISTQISLGAKDKFRTLAEKRNPVDNTIFQAVEHVADTIILEMTKIAVEQQEKAKAAGKVEEPDPKKNKKLKLEKIKEEEGSKWDNKPWTLSMNLGANFPVSDLGQYMAVGQHTSFQARRLIWGNFFAGSTLLFTFNSGKTSDPVRTQFFTISAIASGGYQFRLSDRFRLITEIGAGYYGAILNIDYKRSDSGEYDTGLSKKMHNPALSTGLGFHWLAFEKIFFGLEVHATAFADKGNPWPIAVQSGLSAGFIF